MTDAQALIAALTENVRRQLSAEEAAALLACDSRPLLVTKILATHCYRAGDYAAAIGLARGILAEERNAENAKNLLHILTKARRIDEGLALAPEIAAILSPIVFNDLMCALFNAAGRIGEAVAHGAESLRLKDEEAPTRTRDPPVIRRFDPSQPARNVIAFSLFGDQPRYLMGARNNAIVARYLYPGWTARFYVDDSVPAAARQMLRNEAAQVLKVDGWPAERYGTFWRFLVEDDAEVELFLVRDADSVLTIRERAAVEAWLASGKAFHVMRDDAQHSELILAGLWGGHRGNIGDMARRVQAYVAKAPVALNDATIDQRFLRHEIWPLVRPSLLSHDAHYKVAGAVPWPESFTLPPGRHVGQNDWVYYKRNPPPGAAD